jgi:hypothetical protein
MWVRLFPLLLSPAYIEEGLDAPPNHDDAQEQQYSDDNI